tara:strand:- start:1085 stop:1969 length:885 start_codon:yes stop_codon:yes gene_type:complete
MKKFSNNMKYIVNDTNKFLNNLFIEKKNISKLIKPMKYGIFSGGKRFRATIVINMGRIFNIDYKSLISIAAAVECIHSYSLIHDDLPAMDNDDLRRGKLSTHKKFNEFTAILAGNSLLTLAFEILSSKNLKLSAKIKNELITTLAIYSGSSGLADGQYLDLTYENKKISKEKIIDLQRKKTGKLFAFCCESIGIIKGQSLKKRKKLKNIGLDIGLLFQIADDLIDHKGDIKIVGKPTKSDKIKGKRTLINLIGYKGTLNFANKLKRKIKSEIIKFGPKSINLLQLIEFILKRNF